MVVKIDAWITITEQNWAFWVAGLFALFEFFRWAYGGVEWVAKTFGVETKRSLAQKKWEDRLTNTEKAIVEIKDASKKNVEMFLDHERQVVEKFTGIKNEIVKELNKLQRAVKEKGLTIVGVKLYIAENGYAKILIALARGKKEYDKRASIKEKDLRREMDRL